MDCYTRHPRGVDCTRHPPTCANTTEEYTAKEALLAGGSAPLAPPLRKSSPVKFPGCTHTASTQDVQ